MERGLWFKVSGSLYPIHNTHVKIVGKVCLLLFIDLDLSALISFINHYYMYKMFLRNDFNI